MRNQQFRPALGLTLEASYMEPEDLPIDVAAIDPLDGDLLFGIEDKPDELRTKFNYEQPVGEGKNISKEARATKTQLDRLSRDIQTQVPENLGPRFSRFIARSQAAMELGVNKQDMLDWFYGGRDDVDPFRMAAAGYTAEARWLAAENQPRDITQEGDQTQEGFVPDFLKDQGTGETDTVEDAAEESVAFSDDSAGEGWFNDEPAQPATEAPTDSLFSGHQMAAKRAVVNGDDRDYDWLLPAKFAEDLNQLQPDDEVETQDGQGGKVTEVGQDGSFTVQMNDGMAQSTTYKPDAMQNGHVKRKENPSNPLGDTVVTPQNNASIRKRAADSSSVLVPLAGVSEADDELIYQAGKSKHAYYGMLPPGTTKVWVDYDADGGRGAIYTSDPGQMSDNSQITDVKPGKDFAYIGDASELELWNFQEFMADVKAAQEEYEKIYGE